MKVGHPCRKKKSECDVTETCTGLSEWCPKDVHYYNGMQCGNKPKSGTDYPKYAGTVRIVFTAQVLSKCQK